MEFTNKHLSILFRLSGEVSIRRYLALCRELESLNMSKEIRHLNCGPEIRDFVLEHKDWMERCFDEYLKFNQFGARLLTPLSPDYPKGLFSLEEPPLLLSVLGKFCWKNRVTLSVVGSRECSREALLWLEDELPKIICEDVVIVSGAARGIDQRAHEISIRIGRPTMAFLPSGFGHIYPKAFEKWVADVIKGRGCLISEYLLEEKMKKHHFRERNRMIAAISSSTLVVQAGLRSGTLLTANIATEIGRAVLTLPALPKDSKFQGNLKLLFDGANLVRDADDVLGVLALESNKLHEGIALN